jgi:serine/threonine-protein kinase
LEYDLRFKEEIKIIGRIHHPNVVAVYDAGRAGDMAYMVMELVTGSDLKSSLENGAQYSLSQSLRIIADLLDALDNAHRQGVIHRDVKPANVMLSPEERVKLADFGLARIANLADRTLSRGAVLGTPKYMAPEQILGGAIDARCDLFSTGALLYRLLTGMAPFEADSDAQTLRLITTKPHRIATDINPRLPSSIDAVIDRALAKRRDDRYQTANEFRDALAKVYLEASKEQLNAVQLQSGILQAWRDTPLLEEGQIASRSSDSLRKLELELVCWKELQESKDKQDFERFLEKFPTGVYTELAMRRLRKLSADDETDSKS